jgi:hypothetical protein
VDCTRTIATTTTIILAVVIITRRAEKGRAQGALHQPRERRRTARGAGRPRGEALQDAFIRAAGPELREKSAAAPVKEGAEDFMHRHGCARRRSVEEV